MTKMRHKKSIQKHFGFLFPPPNKVGPSNKNNYNSNNFNNDGKNNKNKNDLNSNVVLLFS